MFETRFAACFITVNRFDELARKLSLKSFFTDLVDIVPLRERIFTVNACIGQSGVDDISVDE